ncbi:MAG: ATPase domain-containing protein, partial [Gluconobacter cerinus]
MAKKPTARFVCQSCGAVYSKWVGKCEACGEWNTLVEETSEPTARKTGKLSTGRLQTVRLDGEAKPPPRITTSIAELDRVLGGGLVPASVVLVGGDPGIGKSTLMLQTTCALARSGHKVLYVSGEESVDQIRIRAQRLELDRDSKTLDSLDLAASINVGDIVGSLENDRSHTVVVIDSIQTISRASGGRSPGGGAPRRR